MTDLYDLVVVLKAETNIPGADALVDATDDDYLQRLQNAFWEAYLDKVIPTTYNEEFGTITPDLPRDLQQLIVLYAAFNILTNTMLNMNTKFRTKAGPVEYEVEQSASLLKAMYDAMYKRKKELMTALANGGIYGGAVVFDNVMARDAAFYNGTSSFVTSWAY